MLNKLNNLAFVIGAFFSIVSVILFLNLLVSGKIDTVSVYTASTFLVFGIAMMWGS